MFVFCSSLSFWLLKAGELPPMFKWDRFVPTSFNEVNGSFSIVEIPGIGQEHESGSRSGPLRCYTQANKKAEGHTNKHRKQVPVVSEVLRGKLRRVGSKVVLMRGDGAEES